MKTILVCGLPGSGKTYLATKLKEMFGDDAIHFNGDEFRKTYNDWDFSEAGRRRQAERMRDAAFNAHQEDKYAILDFVCPKQEYRHMIKPDTVFWMTRTPVRDYPDTTAMFEPLVEDEFDTILIDDSDDVDNWVNQIHLEYKTLEFDFNKPTALMIGRYQPFHDGHKALFVEAMKKHGQVCIGVRDMPKDEKNPSSYDEVIENIHAALVSYRGRYVIEILPNIVDVVYGRDVGWTVSKIDLPAEIEAISATKIREKIKNAPVV